MALDPNATVGDGGQGALIFFYGKIGPNPATMTVLSGANHIGIIDGQERIDNNCFPSGSPPAIRGILDKANDYLPDPPNAYWGTAYSGAPPGTRAGVSILQQLDEE